MPSLGALHIWESLGIINLLSGARVRVLLMINFVLVCAVMCCHVARDAAPLLCSPRHTSIIQHLSSGSRHAPTTPQPYQWSWTWDAAAWTLDNNSNIMIIDNKETLLCWQSCKVWYLAFKSVHASHFSWITSSLSLCEKMTYWWYDGRGACKVLYLKITLRH